MSKEIVLIILMISTYRIVSLIVGLGFAYMGYKLFLHGVFDKAGELQAAWGEKKLLLKQAAPGTFFSLFGTVIIVVALWKGLSFGLENGLAGLTEQTTSFKAVGHGIDEEPLPVPIPDSDRARRVLKFQGEASPSEDPPEPREAPEPLPVEKET
ncbi:hypothetical protein Pan241w_07740 [Gimesia alba]|uniref:Uncharacterized protein n=1 Tax=Gimesia alba TaxID=2527973 RepID=A0A517RA03_9PLAN|nr:hypothetical protein [Gimesia alba]QDT40716.1 hypothetical protein Pan241w_07740 [Gimesia alba]